MRCSVINEGFDNDGKKQSRVLCFYWSSFIEKAYFFMEFSDYLFCLDVIFLKKENSIII